MFMLLVQKKMPKKIKTEEFLYYVESVQHSSGTVQDTSKEAEESVLNKGLVILKS